MTVLATDVAIAAWADGEPGRPRAKRSRMTRAQRRAQLSAPQVAALDPESAEALEALTLRRDLSGLPVVSGWRPFGPLHYLREEQLKDLLVELQILLDADDLHEQERKALLDIAELARIALDQDLVMVVVPD